MTSEQFLRDAIQESLLLKTEFFNKNLELIVELSHWLEETRRLQKQVFIFGNGGSAADAQHFAAELVHRVETQELGVRAHALHADTSLITALGNDEGFERIYARQIRVLASSGDLAIGISTSGNSNNVVAALAEAHQVGCRTAGLLGREGGRAKEYCDLALIVPHHSTPRIQEVHTMIIHLVCQLLET